METKTLIDFGPGHTNSESWDFKKAYPDSVILGLEPDRERYEALLEHFPGTILNMAGHNKNENIIMYKNPDSHQQPDMVRAYYDPERESVKVKGITIDQLVINYKLHSPISIFIGGGGGWDLKILEGAQKSLQDGLISDIILEAWTCLPPNEEFVEDWPIDTQIKGFLYKFGYTGHKEIKTYFEQFDAWSGGHSYDICFTKVN